MILLIWIIIFIIVFDRYYFKLKFNFTFNFDFGNVVKCIYINRNNLIWNFDHQFVIFTQNKINISWFIIVSADLDMQITDINLVLEGAFLLRVIWWVLRFVDTIISRHVLIKYFVKRFHDIVKADLCGKTGSLLYCKIGWPF